MQPVCIQKKSPQQISRSYLGCWVWGFGLFLFIFGVFFKNYSDYIKLSFESSLVLVFRSREHVYFFILILI